MVSITPTVLSVSLDQTEALHSTEPSVVEKMRSMSLMMDKEVQVIITIIEGEAQVNNGAVFPCLGAEAV